MPLPILETPSWLVAPTDPEPPVVFPDAILPDFAVDSAETLSGYLIHKHEAIPKVREVIHLSHFDAEILLVSDTRIEKVKLTIH